jgi:hypothetical protein
MSHPALMEPQALRFIAVAMPARAASLAYRLMNIMVVGADLAHRLQAPERRRSPHQFTMVFVKLAERGIRGLAAE